jgi:putative sigma-54 modulation protein
MDIQIQSIQFDADQKLIDLIRKRIEKLQTFTEQIIHVEVFLKLESKSSVVKDKTATIKLQLPGKLLVAEETSKMFEEATDLAVESLRRQIRKYKEKIRN